LSAKSRRKLEAVARQNNAPDIPALFSVVVFLLAAPGPIRWHDRQKINALVYQAIVE
jgi:hypothetical protein